jgi:hypothetical protein
MLLVQGIAYREPFAVTKAKIGIEGQGRAVLGADGSHA